MDDEIQKAIKQIKEFYEKKEQSAMAILIQEEARQAQERYNFYKSFYHATEQFLNEESFETILKLVKLHQMNLHLKIPWLKDNEEESQ